MKHIVLFDLDETIGYFQNISALFNQEISINPLASKTMIIHNLLRTSPDAFRPGIFELFNIILRGKKSNPNIIVALFTNNQGPKYWYNAIISYINSMYTYKLFDQVIGPYKINGVRVEPQRKSHNKSIKDISKILGTNTTSDKYIFFDDQYHSKMSHKNVEYVHIAQYIPGIKSVDEFKADAKEMINKHSFFLNKSIKIKRVKGGSRRKKINKNKKTRKRKNKCN